MPHTKSALKNLRKNRRKRLRNQLVRSRATTAVKKARRLIQAGKMEDARGAVQVACSALDKAAQKGIIHKNNASRRKARLMKQLNRAAGTEQ